MARSKKTNPEQEPDMLDMEVGMDPTQTDSDDRTPQTDLDFDPVEETEADTSWIDPESCQEDDLEDNAFSQTDLEIDQTVDSEAPVPQIDSETDTNPSEMSGISQTEMETAEASAFGIESDLDARQTDMPLEETPDAEDGNDPEPQSDADFPLTTGEPPAPQTDAAQPRKLRMPRQRRDASIVSIDAERSVETDADRLRSDLLDLAESMKGRKILTDMIQGVERPSPSSDLSYAVLYHGSFKVIIPVLEMLTEPEDYRGQPKGDVLNYLLNKRLGAEVDYIVKGVDQETGVAAASRLEAMARKRREYYFRTDLDGNYQIYEGIRAEARVISVIRAGIFIDLFGVETYIPLRELSYQRWVDAAAHYQPGQRVLVKVLEVDRSDRGNPHVTASVKQASENPYEKALRKYSVGSRYVGTVSMVDLNGVFVSLDGGIDCLCTYPPRGRPPRGARVTVRILGINHESNRIWGAITHMSTTR